MLIYSIGLITLLLCFCGLALDLGSFELTKIRMQNAADAAALGAVVASQSGGSMSIAGLQDAAQNGFTAGTGNVTVTISNPPISGTYAGDTSAAQATITKKISGTFIPTRFTLIAQATARGSSAPCVYMLSQYSGHPSLQASHGSFNSTCSFYLGNNYNLDNANFTGSQFYIAGSSSNSNIDDDSSISPTPIFNAPRQSDPLLGIPAPNVGNCNYINKNINNSTPPLSPGTYCGGLTINNVPNGSLQAGTYIILGSLNIHNSTLYGSGVTFYLSQGDGYHYGSSTIDHFAGTLSAPTSGPLQGIVIFSDRTLPPGAANFNASNFDPGTRIDGIIYLPGQNLDANDAVFQGYHYFGLLADSCNLNQTVLDPATDYSTLVGGNPFQAGSAGASLIE